jgi:hypothetical protein
MRPVDLHRVRLPGVVPGRADVGDGSVHVGKIPRTYAFFWRGANTASGCDKRNDKQKYPKVSPIVGDAGIVFFRTKPEDPAAAFKRKAMSENKLRRWDQI